MCAATLLEQFCVYGLEYASEKACRNIRLHVAPSIHSTRPIDQGMLMIAFRLGINHQSQPSASIARHSRGICRKCGRRSVHSRGSGLWSGKGAVPPFSAASCPAAPSCSCHTAGDTQGQDLCLCIAPAAGHSREHGGQQGLRKQWWLGHRERGRFAQVAAAVTAATAYSRRAVTVAAE